RGPPGPLRRHHSGSPAPSSTPSQQPDRPAHAAVPRQGTRPELPADPRGQEPRTTEAYMTDEMITYRRADGELIAGEYYFVTELEFFTEANQTEDYFELIEERWTRTSEKVIALGNLHRWCHQSEEDVSLNEPVNGNVYCPTHQPEP